MKELKSRTEIASAINFHRYPVLTLDLVDKDEYGLKGCNVLVDFGKFNTGEPWYEKGELRVYRDECRFEIKAFGACLKKDFTYSDYKEILSYANAPIIKADQEILICVYDSNARLAFNPIVLKTGGITKHCSTQITLEPYNARMFLRCAGFKEEEIGYDK